MSALIVAFSPFITSALTGWIKTWTPFTNLSAETRTPVVRFLAALVSLVYIILGMWQSGSFSPDVLTNAVTVVVLALLSWLGSLGLFHAFFQKAADPQTAPVQ